MKNDSFKKWDPIKDVPAELFLDSITDDHMGLTIILRGEKSDDSIVFKFGLFVLSYQSTTETCVLKSLDDHLLLKSEWPLFVSNESGYIDWLVNQSYKITEDQLKFHYIIKHADGMIDIVTTEAPEAKWRK